MRFEDFVTISAVYHMLCKVSPTTDIYDQNGEAVTSISAPGRLPTDGLKAYNEHSISVQKGALLYSYDKQGRQTGITPMVQR